MADHPPYHFRACHQGFSKSCFMAMEQLIIIKLINGLQMMFEMKEEMRVEYRVLCDDIEQCGLWMDLYMIRLK